MAIVHRAEDHEAELMREAFGERVAGVMFYDGEARRDPWMVVAYDAEGREIGRAFESDPDNDAESELFEIPSERGETVKFGVQIQP